MFPKHCNQPKIRHINSRNFNISVAPKLEGKSKMPYFSLWLENARSDSEASAFRNVSMQCPIYESFRSFLAQLIKAGGCVVHFAPMARFTPPFPTCHPIGRICIRYSRFHYRFITVKALHICEEICDSGDSVKLCNGG